MLRPHRKRLFAGGHSCAPTSHIHAKIDPPFYPGKPNPIIHGTIDLSGIESQESLNELLLFWQKKVVEDASLWRHGFSVERLRLAIRDFVNHYGSDILSAVKLTGGKG